MQTSLSGGLILRSLSEGYESDRDRLPDFYATVFGAADSPAVKPGMKAWTRHLMDGHPTVTGDDIFVVVDPAKDDLIVSATLLIPQVWHYEDVPLRVGRPELVATHPEYRHRGLVRALFDAVHRRSAMLGHDLLGITGIPYFYRQFGYTMAVDLGASASLPLGAVDDPQPDAPLSYTLRPAAPADIPDLMAWTDYFARERLLTTCRTADEWQYELTGRRDSSQECVYLIIQNADGRGVGYIAIMPYAFERQSINLLSYVVGPDSSYLETFNDTMKAAKVWITERRGCCPAVVNFGCGIHPALAGLIDRQLGGSIRSRTYAWYLRVPDPVAFLQRIAPVLERRLEGSGANRYTGELKIGFYNRQGLTLRFERGGLSEVSCAQADGGFDVSYPWDLFWNVVFGYRTPDEIRSILPDTWANAKGFTLLNVLFPKRESWLVALA